ncbi:MAG: hypothetical protein GY723_11085 [bacterium]|nr:hypothetical protein [bacterium]MCP5066493.1 hypothetical protein [bacterium]
MKDRRAWIVALAASLALVVGCTGTIAKTQPDNGVLAEVPFIGLPRNDGSQSSHVVVDVMGDPQHPIPMLLDTGAAHSVMTAGFAKSHGISVRRIKSSDYRRKTVLGRDLQFLVDTKRSDTGSRSGWETGLIGGNFLESYTTEIDYVARRVRFHDPRKSPVPKIPSREGEIIVPLEIRGRRPYAILGVGNDTASFMVDTGANFDLEVSERTASRLGISIERGKASTGRNWIGRDRSLETPIDSVRVGDRDLGPSTVRIALSEGSDWRHTNQAGSDEAVMGSDFLSHYHIRIDYKHQRMSLLPLSSEEYQQVLASLGLSDSTPLPTKHAPSSDVSTVPSGPDIGASLTEIHPGQFQVGKVERHGPAAQIGLRKGDMILSAYGDEQLQLSTVKTRIVDGEEITVARRDGKMWIDIVLPEPVYSDE